MSPATPEGNAAWECRKGSLAQKSQLSIDSRDWEKMIGNSSTSLPVAPPGMDGFSVNKRESDGLGKPLTIAVALGIPFPSTPRMALGYLSSTPALELKARCDRHVDVEGLFLDASRLEARSLARIAYRSLVDPLVADIDSWIRSQIEGAAVELITEDLLLDGSQRDVSANEPASQLARVLGLQSGLALRACAQLNLLPTDVRRVCRRLFLEAAPLHECAQQLGMSAEELRQRVESVLEAIHKVSEVGGYDGPERRRDP